MLPNLIIAGVVKGGTTSLFSYLSKHPDVCAASVKETCFFLPVRYGKQLSAIEDYSSHFAHCGATKYVMEATPGYFEGGARLAKSLKDRLESDLRILIVLRDPIERMKSFFKYKKSMLELGKELRFEEYVRKCNEMPLIERQKQENDRYWGIDGGFYDVYLEEWLGVFGENIKVTFFDELKENPVEWMKDICEWLNIDGSMYEAMEFAVENKSVGYRNIYFQKLALWGNRNAETYWRRHPRLKDMLREFYYRMNGQPYLNEFDAATLRKLDALYRPHNDRVGEILRAAGYTELPLWLK